MKTVRFSVAADASLSDINTILSDQESKCCEFLDGKVAYEAGGVVNLVTFTLYDDVEVPKTLILKKKDEEAPDNASRFWEGIMSVNKELTIVTAYRET